LILIVVADLLQSIVFYASALFAFRDPGAGHLVSKETTQNIFRPGAFIFSYEPGVPS
jgi:hypothetical protein